MANSRLSHAAGDKCALPFMTEEGGVVFFDVQAANPGAFTVPGVVDLETYEPGDVVETSWIYFKGDLQAGPQPGHPFERPFDDAVKFSVDMVREDDTSKVVQEIMGKTPPPSRPPPPSAPLKPRAAADQVCRYLQQQQHQHP